MRALADRERITRVMEAFARAAERIGRVTFHHFDPYSQALAKIERGHRQDVADVRQMLASGLIEPSRVRSYFAEIEPLLYRFPAIDAAGFRRAVDAMLP